MKPPRKRQRPARRAGLAMAILVLAAILAFALSRLNLSHIGHALISVRPDWVLLAVVLMMLSLLLRAVSWQHTLRAALPDAPIGWLPVIRATMIGVMTSAVLPGRIGEPTRILVVTRRMEGSRRGRLPVVAGTVFSQTLINLVALCILAVVTFTSVPLLHGHASALEVIIALPLIVGASMLGGPPLMRLAQRSQHLRVRTGANALGSLLRLVRRGLVVFTRPGRGMVAVGAQLLAWALQWAACYMVVLALGLEHQATPITAAAILLAVNVSAVLPATPSNVGVFQAACLAVLAAYGVGAGPGLAYGIILQAVEVFTALVLGVPALLGEGMTWQDIRRRPIS